MHGLIVLLDISITFLEWILNVKAENFSYVETIFTSNSSQLLFTMTQNGVGGKQRKTDWSFKSGAPECNNLRHDTKHIN